MPEGCQRFERAHGNHSMLRVLFLKWKCVMAKRASRGILGIFDGMLGIPTKASVLFLLDDSYKV